MRTLLDGLAALALGAVTLPASPEHAVPMPAKPNETRKRAFGILKVDPAKGVAMQAPGWSRRMYLACGAIAHWRRPEVPPGDRRLFAASRARR